MDAMAAKGEEKKQENNYEISARKKHSVEFIDNVQNEWVSDALKYLICVRTKSSGKAYDKMKNHKIRPKKKAKTSDKKAKQTKSKEKYEHKQTRVIIYNFWLHN